MKPISGMLIRAGLAALLAGGLAACTDDPETQTVSGRLQGDSFGAPAIGVRAVIGGEVVAEAPVYQGGYFSLAIPRGNGYRLEVVTRTRAHLLMGDGGGSYAPLTFDVCDPGDDFDLGQVVSTLGGGAMGGDGSEGGPGNSIVGCPTDPDPCDGDDCDDPVPWPCDPDVDPDCDEGGPGGWPTPCDEGDPDCGMSGGGGGPTPCDDGGCPEPTPCDPDDEDCPFDEPVPCVPGDADCGCLDLDQNGICDCDELPPPPPCEDTDGDGYPDECPPYDPCVDLDGDGSCDCGGIIPPPPPPPCDPGDPDCDCDEEPPPPPPCPDFDGDGFCDCGPMCDDPFDPDCWPEPDPDPVPIPCADPTGADCMDPWPCADPSDPSCWPEPDDCVSQTDPEDWMTCISGGGDGGMGGAICENLLPVAFGCGGGWQ